MELNGRGLVFRKGDRALVDKEWRSRLTELTSKLRPG